MRHDLKIRRVLKRYGLRGYGLYNMVLESITENIDDESPMPELHETAEDIASFYGEDTTAITEMMTAMVKEGLFDVDDITGRIMCRKIFKFLEMSSTRSEKVRKLIENYKKTDCLLLSRTVTDKNGQIVPETETETEVLPSSDSLNPPPAKQRTPKQKSDSPEVIQLKQNIRAKFAVNYPRLSNGCELMFDAGQNTCIQTLARHYVNKTDIIIRAIDLFYETKTKKDKYYESYPFTPKGFMRAKDRILSNMGGLTSEEMSDLTYGSDSKKKEILSKVKAI